MMRFASRVFFTTGLLVTAASAATKEEDNTSGFRGSHDGSIGNGHRSTGDIGMNTRIIGGDEADVLRYAYMASFQRGGGHHCGGSLIAPDVVLSAAHCAFFETEEGSGQFEEIDFTEVDAVVGRHILSTNEGQVKQVRERILHPDYIPTSEDNDFLLLFLTEQVDTSDDVSLVQLNAGEAVPAQGGKSLTVMGWGDTVGKGKENFMGSDVLLEVEVKYVTTEDCSDSDGLITENMMCAHDPGEDSCQGDSGGPLVILGNDPNGAADVQVGVVSWGFGCAGDFPGVYARVSSQYEWIKTQVCVESADPPPSFECGITQNPTPPSTPPPTRTPSTPPPTRTPPTPTSKTGKMSKSKTSTSTSTSASPTASPKRTTTSTSAAATKKEDTKAGVVWRGAPSVSSRAAPSPSSAFTARPSIHSTNEPV